MTDAKTITRAIDGDEAAQRMLYEMHHAPAFRLAYLLLQESRDAEEVVQDAFVYVFRNLRRYDPNRGTFWAWLRVVLVSRCRNKRRRRVLPSISLEVLEAVDRVPADPKPASDPVNVLERLGVRKVVWEALQQVSPGARDALILRYYEELPYTEIANILGCSNDAARSRVIHGKAQLRRLLTAPDEEPVREREIARAVEAR